MSRRQFSTLPASLVVALALAACGSSSSTTSTSPASSGPTGSITVLAAASLTKAFDLIDANFEKAHPGTTITVSYGASSALATQITQGAPADVFASASQKTMESVVSAVGARPEIA